MSRSTGRVYALMALTRKLLCSGEVGVNSFTRNSMLEFSKLKYNSVEINVSHLKNEDVASFEYRLNNTVQHLREKKICAAYLSIPISRSSLIEPAGRVGFRYHHAEDDIAKLFLWMEDSENKIPSFGTHTCGVGGVVRLEGTNKILVIKEKPPYNVNWKLPGGYCNLGEDFCEAVVREVWEETNIKSHFNSILAFRHSHSQQFGRSNLYVICLLNACEEELTEISVDSEIEVAKWMEIEEYKELTSDHPMSQQIVALLLHDRSQEHDMNNAALGKKGEGLVGLKEKTISSALSGPLPYKFYHI